MPETAPQTDAHPIRLRNTLTRRVEPFVPLDPKNVRMYVCGPTVYDRAHLGNARAAVVYDVLFRLLRHVYGPEHVTYVRNITDIDDKIIARAQETGRSVEDITEETIRWYHEDMDALGCLRPTDVVRPNGMRQMYEPRATEFLPQMIAMIEALIEGGHAYEAEGHVLFSVASYSEYGRLSGRSVEDMIAGARVDVAPYKRDPMDFVLWKPSGEGRPRLALPLGPRPPRLAHRVLRDGARPPGRRLRHPRRRAWTSNFPTTRTSSPRAVALTPTRGSRRCGFTTRCFRSKGGRCPRAWATSSRCATLLDQGVTGEVQFATFYCRRSMRRCWTGPSGRWRRYVRS